MKSAIKTDAQIPGARSFGLLNVARWGLIFVGPCRTGFMPLFEVILRFLEKNLCIPMHNGYYNGASYQPKAPLWTSRTFVLEYCMDIQVLKNEKNDTPATFLFYHISFNCVYSFNHFSSHTNNRHHRTSQRHSKLHAVFSAGKYSV